MTRHKTFKHKVRARMEKTGESYTAARRMLIADGERPPAPEVQFEPVVSEKSVREATGRGWDEWFARLDEWGAAKCSHSEIVAMLAERAADVPGWWKQSITVSYERARGLRAPGQRPDGWAATASKTVAVPVERLFAAFAEPALRERWLPGAQMDERTLTAPKYARFDWEDGSTRVIAGFEAMDGAKSMVGLSHERLPDADTADEMKAYWRDRVAELKAVLEGDDE